MIGRNSGGSFVTRLYFKDITEFKRWLRRQTKKLNEFSPEDRRNSRTTSSSFGKLCTGGVKTDAVVDWWMFRGRYRFIWLPEDLIQKFQRFLEQLRLRSNSINLRHGVLKVYERTTPITFWENFERQGMGHSCWDQG